MRRLLILCCIVVLLFPGCAVSRARVFNYTNAAVDTTAAVAAGAVYLTVGALWNGMVEDDDDFDDTAYKADETSEQRVHYE